MPCSIFPTHIITSNSTWGYFLLFVNQLNFWGQSMLQIVPLNISPQNFILIFPQISILISTQRFILTSPQISTHIYATAKLYPHWNLSPQRLSRRPPSPTISSQVHLTLVPSLTFLPPFLRLFSFFSSSSSSAFQSSYKSRSDVVTGEGKALSDVNSQACLVHFFMFIAVVSAKVHVWPPPEKLAHTHDRENIL